MCYSSLVSSFWANRFSCSKGENVTVPPRRCFASLFWLETLRTAVFAIKLHTVTHQCFHSWKITSTTQKEALRYYFISWAYFNSHTVLLQLENTLVVWFTKCKHEGLMWSVPKTGKNHVFLLHSSLVW